MMREVNSCQCQSKRMISWSKTSGFKGLEDTLVMILTGLAVI